jgi:magnesium-transporting ATPase (P-type)
MGGDNPASGSPCVGQRAGAAWERERVAGGEGGDGLGPGDAIRDGSRQAVRRLHAVGLEVARLAGDGEAVARSAAVELGMDTCFAQALPEHKDLMSCVVAYTGQFF